MTGGPEQAPEAVHPDSGGGHRGVFLLQLLQTAGPMSVPQLAAALGVPPGTVHGDIAALAGAGIPARESGTLDGGYEVPAGYGRELAHARRLAAILRLLVPGRLTGQQLAAALGISLQTVHRDAGALTAAGIPLRARAGGAGGYTLPADYAARLETLGAADVQLLVLAGMAGAGPGDDMVFTSWAYAVHGDLPEPLIGELRRAHQLKLALAEAAEEHAMTVNSIWASCPELATARAEFEQADAELRMLNRRAKHERARNPRRRATAETLALLGPARARRAAASNAYQRARARHYPRLVPQFAAALDKHRAAVPAICQAAAAAGLAWDTVNAVSAWYRLRGTREAGQLSQRKRRLLRANEWDGTGTVTVQLERLEREPPRSPELLASPRGRYRNKVLLQPWMPPGQWDVLPIANRRRLQQGILRMQIGSGVHACHVTLPVDIHRMLPAAADVSRIRLVRQRVGTRYRAQVLVLARVPKPSPRRDGPVVAARVCWRSLPDRAIRVAVIKGAGPPPRSLVDAGIVRIRDEWAEVVFPSSWQELSRWMDKIVDRRKRGREELRDWLTDWVDQHPGSAGILDPEGSMSSFSVAALAQAAERLRDAARPGYEVPAAALEQWRRSDRRLQEWVDNERDQLRSRRNKAWGLVASWVGSQATHVVLEKWPSPSPARRLEDGDGPDDMAARANLRLSAPYLLHQKLVRYARVRGVPVQLVAAPGMLKHRACGTALAATDSPLASCPPCGVEVDQDLDVLPSLLAAADPVG